METQDRENNILLESAIAEKLELSYEKRIEAHEKARQLTNELRRVGEEQRAGSKQAS